ncbi:putative defective protein IntQ [Calidithermus terrae]|uniref:Putative defective protein IntQ n=1 Tax=Calidithermus terrae TaxID=1408545 RepID=A0A399ET37_9DEIN|nr:site-specific integrase [Calidithermus terrae]RIH85391.1 putative defective protein IntQ [Calidithermus terrae]
MPKRGKGAGTTYFHKGSGRWCAELNLGFDGNGKPLRVRSYHPTRKAAEAWLAEQVALYHKGVLADPSKMTLREWAEQWLERKRREVRPNTYDAYKRELGYALPVLGKLPLQKITPAHVRALVDDLSKRLTPRTVRMVRQKLHALLEEALNLELVHRNAAAPVKVKAPRGKATERVGRALERHEATMLLAALDQHGDERTSMCLRLMLNMGLRVGEALGLKWEDLDLEKALLVIRRTHSHGRENEPKTPSSCRVLPIPHATLVRLKAYHQRWTERLKEPPPPDMWLFPGNAPARPLDYNAPGRALRRIIQRLEKERLEREQKTGVKETPFPRLRAHDLRHAYASLMLSAGTPVELVAERLGHSNATITLSIYRHVLEHERQGWLVDTEALLTQPRAKA